MVSTAESSPVVAVLFALLWLALAVGACVLVVKAANGARRWWRRRRGA